MTSRQSPRTSSQQQMRRMKLHRIKIMQRAQRPTTHCNYPAQLRNQPSTDQSKDNQATELNIRDVDSADPNDANTSSALDKPQQQRNQLANANQLHPKRLHRPVDPLVAPVLRPHSMPMTWMTTLTCPPSPLPNPLLRPRNWVDTRHSLCRPMHVTSAAARSAKTIPTRPSSSATAAMCLYTRHATVLSRFRKTNGSAIPVLQFEATKPREKTSFVASAPTTMTEHSSRLQSRTTRCGCTAPAPCGTLGPSF